MTNELVDLLPWLDGYVVGQSYTHSSSFDFSEAVTRGDIIKRLQAFEPENATILALLGRCPDFHIVPVKNRVMLMVDTDVVHVWHITRPKKFADVDVREDRIAGELTDLLPWLDGYVVGQVEPYEVDDGDLLDDAFHDLEAVSRTDVIKKLQRFEPENGTTLAQVRRCPDFHIVPVKNRVMLIVDTDVVHVWQFNGIEEEEWEEEE